MYPSLADFKKLAAEGKIIPVFKEMLADIESPVGAFMKLGPEASFLLESIESGRIIGRYSFVGLRPLKTIVWQNQTLRIIDKDGDETRPGGDPLDYIKAELARYEYVPVKGLPAFTGGYVGYMGYDIIRTIEDIPDTNPDPLGMPDMYMMLTDTMLVFDNLKQKLKVVTHIHATGQDLDKAYGDAEARIDGAIAGLRTYSGRPFVRSVIERDARAGLGDYESEFGTREAFIAAVERARQYIRAGDIVQVVLSQRFTRKTTVSPFMLYRALRTVNPSSYMFYMTVGDAAIVGSSPEIMVSLMGERIKLKPIAGTRQRAETEEGDRALADDLIRDEKERAEHVMLLDLGRNDVGRVARIGSVEVTKEMDIEYYSHVMHIVSTVEGRINEGLDAVDVFRASFPAGTVSGAPKVRAMQIIDELEPQRRGVYAGAVGYFGFSGDMDTCIAIRTLIVKDGKAHVQAGAGIVWYSDPESEYMETVNKAAGMMTAVTLAEEIERQNAIDDR